MLEGMASRKAMLALCGTLWLTGGVARAQGDVCSKLSAGIDSYVPSASYKSQAGVEQALIACFQREDLPRHARLRALDVLASLPSPRVEQLFRSLLEARTKRREPGAALPLSQSIATLRRALSGLCALGAELEPELLARYLTHADVGIRLAAVQLAARQPGARAVLEKQRARERSPRVKRAIEAALRDRTARP